MIRETFKTLRETVCLMIGLPDYERYCAHMRLHHPDLEPMSRFAFFRDRQEQRYAGRGGGKCC